MYRKFYPQLFCIISCHIDNHNTVYSWVSLRLTILALFVLMHLFFNQSDDNIFVEFFELVTHYFHPLKKCINLKVVQLKLHHPILNKGFDKEKH